MNDVIYLDHNATTPVAREVFEAMVPWLTGSFGNPSSIYRIGREAAAALDVARGQVAALAGCRHEEIVFTSCGTESINTAIQAALALDPDRRHIITSAVEHSATMKACEHLARRGYEVTWLGVDSLGRLDPGELKAAIRSDTALVSLLWANNETGVLFPVGEVASITQAARVPLHIDAVQAFGKLPLDLGTLGVQFMSFSGHKIYAPKGVGALYASRRVRFTPMLRGSQEEERRGGTQNVASIVGFGCAAALAADRLNTGDVAPLRDRFETSLLERLPGVRINGDRTNRLPNTTNLSFEDVESEGALILLDEKGVCCSAGSACSSASVNPSHVLKAMGLDNQQARSSLRFSIGHSTTAREIDRAIEAVVQAVSKMRALRPKGSPVLAA